MATLTLTNGTVFDGTPEEIGQFLLLSQQPLTEAAAKPQTGKTRSTKTRSAKPKREVKISKAQHAAGRHLEVAFGVDANGKLSSAQQSRARRIFAEIDGGPYTFPKGTITMASIRTAVREVNASLRGANEVTWSYWAVFNGPKGRLTDEQARQFMAGQQRQSR